MNYKNGHSTNKNRLYRIYWNMKSRCYNPKHNRFYRYGARGIRICQEWLDDFQAFYDWAMANGYQDDLTIDRIDSDKNYEPSNCQWVTYKEQNINKNCVPKYEYQGKIFCQSEVFELFGVKRTTFQARLRRGLSVSEALGR